MNRVSLYIYAAVLTASIDLFFNPLRRSLLRFCAGYILIIMLAFRLRFGYKTKVFYMRYFSSSY